MRHKKSNKRLGRDTQHRVALKRNLVASLIKEERIETTLVKAKHHRRAAEKLITLARVKNLQRYRRALAILQDEDAVKKLFDVLGPRYKDRPGGYTRVLKLGRRRLGDKGALALFELVDNDYLERKARESAEKEALKKDQDKKKPSLSG
jgi:large subunit ribosomal protein L17